MKKHIIATLLLIFCTVYANDDEPSVEDISQVPTPPPTPTPQQPVAVTTPTPAPTSPSQPTATRKSFVTPAMVTQVWSDKKTDANRFQLTPIAEITSVLFAGSNTYSLVNSLFNNYPPASAFFPTNGKLATSFNVLINAMQTDKYFFLFLKRLHAIVLQELYAYLKKIYTNIDLVFINSVEEYAKAESMYALNSKKLILHHLMNIVDGQSYMFSRSLFPKLGKAVATQVGSTIIQNDKSADLSWLMYTDNEIQSLVKKPQQVPVFKTWQKQYLGLFKKYFNFFREFTAEITFLEPGKEALGINRLAAELEKVRVLLKNQVDANKPVTPQFFFPSKGTIRGISIIPALIKTIPAKVQSMGWPVQIVAAAQNGTHAINNMTQAALPFPIAYFQDARGNQTTNLDSAQGLYMNMISGSQIFEQQLLKQPAWLNTQEGILNMLRGTLGDFSALVNMNILDPQTEKVISAALFS